MRQERFERTATQVYEAPKMELIVWEGDVILGTSTDVGETYPEYWD